MAPIAVLECSATMQSRLSETPSGARFSRTFAYPALLWRPRTWHLGVFLAPQADGRTEVIGLGLVHPGRLVTTYERAIIIEDYEGISPPLSAQAVRSRLRSSSRDVLAARGPLTDAQGRSLLSALVAERSTLAPVVDRLVAALEVEVPPGPAGEKLAWEKDATGVLFEVAGVDRDLLRQWRPSAALEQVPFLEGMPAQDLRTDEYRLIAHDAERFAGWFREDAAQVGWRVFRNGDDRLFIYNADSGRVEHSLGVDLIYFNQSYRSFVLVQYKRIDPQDGGYRPTSDRNLDSELKRMGDIDRTCGESGGTAVRLLPTPCLVKICESQTIVTQSADLIEGMYLAREHFEQLLASDETTGPRGGVVLSKATVRRYLNNTTFTTLVRDGWIGSRETGSDYVASRVRESLTSGRAVVVGLHQTVRAPGNGGRRRR